jgi:DNA/RNA-binding domain of Phe-tRNA-synthetase-like protein
MVYARRACQTPGMILFRYAEAVLERFPSVVGAVIDARGIVNGPSPPELAEMFHQEQRAALRRLGDVSLAEIPSLAAWRRAFSAFGVEPTRYRSAAEALLRRLTKQGDIPSLGRLVDLGNLVSVRYALPVAVFDRRAVTGTTTVRFAVGSERFTDLGSEEEERPEPGEVVFVDDAGLVSARRWCWRQSAESATRSDTTEVLVTVEGHHPDARGDVAAALEDLAALLVRHVPTATIRSALLSADRPAFPAEGA